MKIIFGFSEAAGVGVNQCAACFRVFGGIDGFDRHRVGLRCNDPATVGLAVAATKTFATRAGPQPFPIWSRPGPAYLTTVAPAA